MKKKSLKQQAQHQMSRKTGRKVFLLLFSLSRNLMMSWWPCLAARSRGVFLFLSRGSNSTVLCVQLSSQVKSDNFQVNPLDCKTHLCTEQLDCSKIAGDASKVQRGGPEVVC